MAKESTAIANLLEIEARRPIERESGDDLLFAPRAIAEPPKAKPPRARSVRELLAAPKVHDTHQLTHRISRASVIDARKPLLAGALVLGGLAFGLTVYKVTRSSTAHAAVAAAAIAPAAPPTPIIVEPVALPVVAPPPPPGPKPTLVDVVLESKPAGATVKVGNQLAGTTPLSLSVDQAKDLDVTFAYDGQAKTVHVDPHTMKHVTVELAVVEPDPVAAPAPVHAARAAAPPKRAAGGTGTLMISTKPPCDIAIDGASTGLTAPQKSIPLAAGHHQLTLTNKAQHMKKVVAVDVTANHATRVIKDFM